MLLNSYSNRLDQSVSQLTIPIQFPDIKKSRPQVSCEKNSSEIVCKTHLETPAMEFSCKFANHFRKAALQNTCEGLQPESHKNTRILQQQKKKIIIRLTFTLIISNPQMDAAYEGRFFIQRGIFFIFPYMSPDIYVT